jgi:hypothetical protein
MPPAMWLMSTTLRLSITTVYKLYLTRKPCLCVLCYALRSCAHHSLYHFVSVTRLSIYTIGHQERSDRRLSSLKIEPVHFVIRSVLGLAFLFSHLSVFCSV